MDANYRFNEFWEAYPKKVGKIPCNKKWKSFLTSWKKKSKENKQLIDKQIDFIIKDLTDRMLLLPQWRDDKIILNPLTYLNQERWRDEWRKPIKAVQPTSRSTYTPPPKPTKEEIEKSKSTGEAELEKMFKMIRKNRS